MKKFISIMFIFILLFQISGCNSDNADLIMPEKGQNISIENNEYKVIKVDGKNALLLLNEPYGEIITFGNNNSYENSNVDKACEDFYNSLPDNMKKAIKNKKININEYNDDSANLGSYLYESKKRVQTLSRHAYLLDLEDIEDFLNGEHTTDSINNLINDKKK